MCVCARVCASICMCVCESTRRRKTRRSIYTSLFGRVVIAAQTRALVMSLRFQVRRIDGTAVCEVEAHEKQKCQVLKQQVSDHLGICKCKIALVVGKLVLRNGFYVKRIMRFVGPSRVLTCVVQPIVLTTVADLHAKDVCFQCMKELGVLATEILALPIPVDVVKLRAAGFKLGGLAPRS